MTGGDQVQDEVPPDGFQIEDVLLVLGIHG